MDMLLEAQRDFFSRSMLSKPAAPAPTPDTPERPRGDSGLLPFVSPPQGNEPGQR
jgi:hypothetical protein